jgi:hypothetical protein
VLAVDPLDEKHRAVWVAYGDRPLQSRRLAQSARSAVAAPPVDGTGTPSVMRAGTHE